MTNEWLEEAHRRFGDREDVFEFTDDQPWQVWINLVGVFREAYRQRPLNEADIAKVYGYADWCLSQSRGETADDDLPTMVACCFYETIPTIPEAAKDMPRWFKRQEVVEMKEIFSYLAGEDGYQQVLGYFGKQGV